MLQSGVSPEQCSSFGMPFLTNRLLASRSDHGHRRKHSVADDVRLNTFVYTVHQHSGLPPSNKFTYLKFCGVQLSPDLIEDMQFRLVQEIRWFWCAACFCTICSNGDV